MKWHELKVIVAFVLVGQLANASDGSWKEHFNYKSASVKMVVPAGENFGSAWLQCDVGSAINAGFSLEAASRLVLVGSFPWKGGWQFDFAPIDDSNANAEFRVLIHLICTNN